MSPGSSWTAGLNFSPKIFHPPTFLAPGAGTTVGTDGERGPGARSLLAP